MSPDFPSKPVVNLPSAILTELAQPLGNVDVDGDEVVVRHPFPVGVACDDETAESFPYGEDECVA